MDFEGKVKEINSRARGLIGLINKYLDTQDYSLLPIINSEAHEIAQLKWDDTSPLKGEPVEPAPGRFNECQRSLPTSHQCIDCMVADRCDDPNAEAIGKSIRLKSLNPERVSEPAPASPEKIRGEIWKAACCTSDDAERDCRDKYCKDCIIDAVLKAIAPLLAEAEQKGRREVIEEIEKNYRLPDKPESEPYPGLVVISKSQWQAFKEGK